MTNTVYWIRYMHLLIDFKIVGDWRTLKMAWILLNWK